MEYERGRKDGMPSRIGPKDTFTGRVLQDALLSHTAVSLGVASWAEEVADDHYLGAFEQE